MYLFDLKNLRDKALRIVLLTLCTFDRDLNSHGLNFCLVININFFKIMPLSTRSIRSIAPNYRKFVSLALGGVNIFPVSLSAEIKLLYMSLIILDDTISIFRRVLSLTL